MLYRNAWIFRPDGSFVYGGFTVEGGRFGEVFSGEREGGTDLGGEPL